MNERVRFNQKYRKKGSIFLVRNFSIWAPKGANIGAQACHGFGYFFFS